MVWISNVSEYVYCGAKQTLFIQYSRLTYKAHMLFYYNEERWYNECYYKLCEYYNNYIDPVLRQYDLETPYQVYERLRVEDNIKHNTNY